MQTAVDYIIEMIKLNDKEFYAMLFEDKVIEQAKEMEKQQIIDALTYGNKTELMASQKMFAEQYYTSTYGSKGSDETKTN